MTIDEARTWLQRHADNTPMPGAREVYRTILDGLDGVRRGWWLEADCFDIGFWQCSCCGFLSEAIAAPKLYKYCPNCGAKMEVEPHE